VVDGQEMNHIKPHLLWDLGSEASPRVRRWESTKNYDFFDGEHNGYGRLPQPVTHRRQIYFNKTEGWWLLRELLTGEGKHRFDLYFHFAPLPIEPAQGKPRAVRTNCQGANLLIIPVEIMSLNESIDLTMEITQEWISPSYGIRHPAPVVRYSCVAQTPVVFRILLRAYVNQVPYNDDIEEFVANVLSDENLDNLMNLEPN